LTGKTAALPVMARRSYIFVRLGGGKSPKVARYFYAFMTISYLLTTFLTVRQIYRISTLWTALVFVIWKQKDVP